MDAGKESAQSGSRPSASSACTIPLVGVESTRLKLLSPSMLRSALLGKSVIESLPLITQVDHDNSPITSNESALNISVLPDHQSSTISSTSSIHPFPPLPTVPDDDQLQRYLLMMPTGSYLARTDVVGIASTSLLQSPTPVMDVSTAVETKKFLVKYLNQHPMLKSFLAGSLSGTCSTLLFQPFDLLKTRVQNAHFAVIEQSCATKPTRFMPIIFDVVKNEQLIGLWRGTAPSLIRCVPGVGLHFCCLDTLQSHFCANRQPSAVEALTFGMASRSIAGILLIPVTVVKTRFESGVFEYKSITHALRHTYHFEGVRGLTSGLLPTLMRDVPFSGLYYMFYSQLKSFVLPHHPSRGTGPLSARHSWMPNNVVSQSFVTFMCGLNAGLMASVVTQPMDVVKTHMQLYPKQFPSFMKTVILIVKRKGTRGLFAGLVPRMVRRTLVASMAWTVYEQMMKNFGLK